ncbi:MAG: TonB-dependent receptor [Balneolaceae bacterium]
MKKTAIKPIRMNFLYFILTVFAFQASSISANAQLITSVSNNLQSNSYYTVNDYSSVIPELRSIITLEKQNVLIGDALKEIAKKAKLGIAFNSDLQILKKNININLKSASVGFALQTVLLGTDYEVAISKNREIVLIKKEPYAKKEIADDNFTVRGIVTDAETGEPLPAVNVFVQGTTVGVSTEVDGTYELSVPDESEVLIFRYIGYITQEVLIDGRTEVNVSLEPDVLAFDDVVVVGYGTQQRTEVTGAISSVRSEDIQNVPVSSFENALQGRMAGVNVAESTGEPGSSPQILIRGTGSISAGNSPLYVVDGVPISATSNLQSNVGTQRASFQSPNANPLATINPKDIESIEVLKDASAAAIYGSRGSNGVILITTKSGQAGRTDINFSAYSGVSTVFNQPDMMNASELIAYTQDSRNNNYLQEIALGNEPANPSYNPATNAGRPNNGNYLIPEQYVNWDGTDTDWLDLVLSPAAMQNYDLSISGGNQTTTYSFSGGYLNQEGIIEGSSFDRFSLRLGLNHKASDRITVGANINTGLTQHDRLPASAPYFGQPPGIIYSAMVHSPVVKPYNADGTINQLDNQSYLGGGTTTASNPLAIMEFISEDITNSRIFGNVYGDVAITDELTFKSLVGYNVEGLQQSFYRGTEFLYRNQSSPQPYAQSSSGNLFNWLWENTLNYNTTFGADHKLNVIVGYTAQKERLERSTIQANGFTDDQITTVNGGIITGGGEIAEEWSLVSSLARANYVFRDKYLLTATVRTDKSSRFGFDNQTGVFPSVSLGWRVNQESFLSEMDMFNELKLRGSYGVTGNFEIPNYGAIGLLGGANYIDDAGNQVNGVAPISPSNEELTWETSYQTNIGLDYALYQDRIYGSIDWYTITTKDLLLSVNLPASSGYASALTNIGEVENTGMEFSVTTRNTVGEFNWATDFNIAANQNKVTKLGPEGDPILSSGGAGVRHITRIGDAIGSYYGFVVEGIYQTQAEIDAAPVDQLVGPGGARPGDFRFKDVNGDGVISNDDRTVIGNYQPDYTYGITNRFSYKGVDLSVFIQGVGGREVLNLTSRHLLNGEANFGSYAALNDRWISESNPGNGEHPRADRSTGTHGNNNRESSYQVQDGAYLKIKNVTMGYTLPVDFLQGAFKRARLYASVTNLAIFTDYIGFNPEVSLQAGSSLTPGEDYGAYPLSRTIQFGIDLSF